MLQDFLFGLKLLRKEKAFAITALLTLALCIGANSAIFTVLNAVILNPLPYPEPDRLVTIYNIYPGVGITRGANGIPDYLDRKQLTDVFESVAITSAGGYDAGADGSAIRIPGEAITPSYLHVLRATPLAGRLFTEDDAVFQKDKFVILSYGLWNEMFARDPAAIGKDMRLSGVPYRIVGVMPDGFGMPGVEARLWVPLTFAPQQTTDDARHNNSWEMVARLKDGVTIATVQQRINALNQFNINRIPQFRKLLIDARFGSLVVGLKDELVRAIRPTLFLLQGAVAFVLLIGCVNVANLMLVRSNIRMKELAIRFSLGARRLRLARQLLTESITLAVLGGALGLLTGEAGVRLLSYLGAKDLPRGATIHMDPRVLAFTATLAVLTGLIFGAIPVVHLMRRDLNSVFRSNERTGTTERGALWTRSALVVSQVSLAFILLIGSGLLALSFVKLLSVDPGFHPQNVTTAALNLPFVRYQDDARANAFLHNLVEDLRRVPGVEHAGFGNTLPFSNDHNDSVIMIDGYERADGENPPVPNRDSIDSGYFAAMGIPLLQGRNFTEADNAGSQRVVIIDEYLARRYWPKGNAVGGGIRADIDPSAPIWRVIGVVATVKESDLAQKSPIGEVYYSYRQNPQRREYIVIKTSREDPHVAAAIRAVLHRADPEIALFDAKTMPERLSASVRDRRAAMTICLIFAALALILSAIGIYGVLAYTVTQRTREFGIRLALGAAAGDVIRMVITHGLRLAAIGLAIGAAGAIVLTRLMSPMLFDVKPTDPLVFTTVAAALMGVAVVASLIPSLRAIRIHPSTALRSE